jgi:CD2 antigen cytoplasmic tail-binding protein 2
MPSKASRPRHGNGESRIIAVLAFGILSSNSLPSGKANVKDAMRVDKPTKGTSDIDHITHLASNLMSLGDTDVYSRTYEELVRSVRSSGKVDASWEPPSADVKYEYKWSVPTGQTGEVFGPFSEDEVKLWFKASYFGPTGEKVKIRQVGGQWGDWSNVVT